MFSNIGDLFVVHKDYLEEINKQVETYPEDLKNQTELSLPKYMQTFAPKLELYFTYVRNFSQSINTLTLASKNKNFKSFLTSVEKKNTLKELLQAPLLVMPYYTDTWRQLAQLMPNNQTVFDCSKTIAGIFSELSSSFEYSQNIYTILPLYNVMAGYPKTLLMGKFTKFN